MTWLQWSGLAVLAVILICWNVIAIIKAIGPNTWPWYERSDGVAFLVVEAIIIAVLAVVLGGSL